MSVALPVLVVAESRITQRVVELTFADQPCSVVASRRPARDLERLADARRPTSLLADVAMLPRVDGYAGRGHRAAGTPDSRRRARCCCWRGAIR